MANRINKRNENRLRTVHTYHGRFCDPKNTQGQILLWRRLLNEVTSGMGMLLDISGSITERNVSNAIKGFEPQSIEKTWSVIGDSLRTSINFHVNRLDAKQLEQLKDRYSELLLSENSQASK